MAMQPERRRSPATRGAKHQRAGRQDAHPALQLRRQRQHRERGRQQRREPHPQLWTSFDNPASFQLSQYNVQVSFLYGPEHQRIREVSSKTVGRRLPASGCAKRAASWSTAAPSSTASLAATGATNAMQSEVFGPTSCTSRRSNSSTALPRWCRHRVRTATGTTACWHPIRRTGMLSRRWHRAQRRNPCNRRRCRPSQPARVRARAHLGQATHSKPRPSPPSQCHPSVRRITCGRC